MATSKFAKKRTKDQRELDLAEMAKLVRRGNTKTQIAEKFGVHRTQVSHDWKALMKRLQAEAREDAMTCKLEEYAEVKQQAWAAWEQSNGRILEEIIEQILEQVESGQEDGSGLPEKFDIKLRSAPANEFLGTILRALEGERELLGLDPPTKSKVDVNSTNVNIDWNELWRRQDDATDPVEERIKQVTGGEVKDGLAPLPNGLKELSP